MMSKWINICKQKKSAVKIGGLGRVTKKSRPIKTVANMERRFFNCHYLGQNGTETWKQYQQGICEHTSLVIQEHSSFSHQWLAAKIRHHNAQFWQLLASGNTIRCCWHCVVKARLPLHSDPIVWCSLHRQSTNKSGPSMSVKTHHIPCYWLSNCFFGE